MARIPATIIRARRLPNKAEIDRLKSIGAVERVVAELEGREAGLGLSI
jgi:hypothetical protein